MAGLLNMRLQDLMGGNQQTQGYGNQMQPAPEMMDLIRRLLILQGGGGMDSSMLEGGGRAQLDLPLSKDLSLMPYVGGGGAFGSVDTPRGKLKIRDWQPDYGAQLRYRF